MLEALAKRMESIRDRVEKIGTKVSDLEAHKKYPTLEAEKVVE